MINFIQEGKRITYTNGTGSTITSGAGVVVGGKLFIACGDILNGADGELLTEGVVELAAITTAAFAQGDKLFWDATAGKLTNVAVGNSSAGIAWAAKTSSAATAQVKLGDMADVGIAAAVTALGTTSNLTTLAPTAASITGSAGSYSTPPTGAEIDTAIDALKDKIETALDAKADNADAETLRTETESRLDAVEAKVDAVIAAFKASGQMAT